MNNATGTVHRSLYRKRYGPIHDIILSLHGDTTLILRESTEPMRVVFMGTPAFAVPTLQQLIDSEFSVVGVVCQPDRPSGRGKKVTWGPIKQLAMAHGLPIVQPDKMKAPALLETLQGWNPDVIVVAAFGRILPKMILDLPPFKCLNVHGSLLPKYRGAAPIQWAVINGEQETGITIMLMDEGMDTGAVLRQGVIKILPEETAGELALRLAELGGPLLVQTLRDWVEDGVKAQPQDDHLATMAPILKKEDGRIDWSQPADILANRIRGLSPWPGAYSFWRGERWAIWKVEVGGPVMEINDGDQANRSAEPGTVLGLSPHAIRVQTGQGILDLKEIQPANKKRMLVRDYLTGHEINVGEQFSQEE